MAKEANLIPYIVNTIKALKQYNNYYANQRVVLIKPTLSAHLTENVRFRHQCDNLVIVGLKKYFRVAQVALNYLKCRLRNSI